MMENSDYDERGAGADDHGDVGATGWEEDGDDDVDDDGDD
jgi:hypothetical protein